jgi:hypothetical protein
MVLISKVRQVMLCNMLHCIHAYMSPNKEDWMLFLQSMFWFWSLETFLRGASIAWIQIRNVNHLPHVNANSIYWNTSGMIYICLILFIFIHVYNVLWSRTCLLTAAVTLKDVAYYRIGSVLLQKKNAQILVTNGLVRIRTLNPYNLGVCSLLLQM